MFNLLYVNGWDSELGEPTGGRCVDQYHTKEAAIAAAKDYSHCAVRLWGRGHLVVTDSNNQFVCCVQKPGIIWDYLTLNQPVPVRPVLEAVA